MTFEAIYSDGYRRTIAGPIHTLEVAEQYALMLEKWFKDGGTNRELLFVTVKQQ